MIGAIACLLFPEAILVDEPDHDKAVQLTRKYFQQNNVILLEAAFESKGKFARPDILIKQGKRLTLIEVKAKSFDSTENNPFQQYEREASSPAGQPIWKTSPFKPSSCVNSSLLLRLLVN